MNDRNDGVRANFSFRRDVAGGPEPSSTIFADPDPVVAENRSYRGPDRRARLTRDTPIPIALIGQSVAVLVVLFLPAGFAYAANEGSPGVTALIKVLTAVILTVAGAACLINWRMQGSDFSGRLGATLITFGVLRAAESLLVGFGNVQVSSFEPLLTFATVSIVGLMMVRAALGPEVDSSLSPLRLVAGGLIVGLLADGTIDLLIARRIVVDAVDSLDVRIERLLLAGIAAIWVLVAANAAIAMKRRNKVPPWSALAVWVFAFGATLRAVAPSAQALESGLLPLLVSGLASAMMMTAAVMELHLVISAVDRRWLRLHIDLDRTHEQIRAEQATLQERLHALRNAITAVRAADSTLRRFASVMEPADRANLADALTVELARVQCLVEPAETQGLVDFSLDVVLRPVLAMEEAFGVQLEAHLEEVRVRGRPPDLAEAVQHLLSNARRYAPGCPVRLSVEERPGRVELRVRDFGPGIPDDERIAVFSRGFRGGSAAGTDGEGLGLHAAARLLTGMGGQLHLEDQPGPGACFRLDLLPALVGPAPGMREVALDGLATLSASAES